MLLFSPPRCDFLSRAGPDKQSTITSRRFAFPSWSAAARTSPIPHSPNSPKPRNTRPSLPPRQSAQRVSQSNSTQTHDMSSVPESPRSPFSPTLVSIPEVFEHDSLDNMITPLASPNENQDGPDVFIPEAACISPASLTRANSRDAIIQSPVRKAKSFAVVSKVLRKVLEADRMRRRRILKVYLKAIIFLKYLWRANERYGNAMVTTGMYMQR
ncbi:hypothetical protein T440DRAFT_468044 [Plenodomus tracheiphilus IPT5]|uniref:Uncharacterized protein n=1 Tax=Plenodomus tracheiphilus IPT5 TaxID=1408161 RepID=A0A6A7B9M3_9PLEO|nr:hypothetical protein T440DRAFT_468044 [Plenodomus tracheiphilus IPT5]